MIDIHCHILSGVDDGPETMGVSLQMCRTALSEGINRIIATPHYIVGEKYYFSISEKIELLRKELKNVNLDIEILPGNEAFIDYEIVDRIVSGQCLTLNKSRYVLLELPMLEVPRCTEEVLYEIQLRGMVPILAHPERNRILCENPEQVYDLVKNGCLMQVNSSSLLGFSGESAERSAKQLLKYDLVHFVATDAHSTIKRRPVMVGVRSLIQEISGDTAADTILKNNPDAVLNDQEIEIIEPTKPEKIQRFWNILNSIKREIQA